MSELATLARPYAKAYFRLALDAGLLDVCSGELALLTGISHNTEFMRYLGQPRWTTAQQAAFFCQVPQELNPISVGLVRELAHYKRLSLMQQVYEHFEAYRSEAECTVEVNLTSAFALNEHEVSEMVTSLSRRMARTVKIQVNVDPSLMGGLVVRTGDLVIDASVRGKIAKMRDTLNSQV